MLYLTWYIVINIIYYIQKKKEMVKMKKDMMWAYLIHLGVRMWNDGSVGLSNENLFNNESYTNDEVWRKVTDYLPSQGFNTIVIDLGEGVVYDSHPELAVEGSWPKAKLAAELDRLRSIGLTPLPKLNFSKCHDSWLGKYHFMVATPEYYKVCEDLIREVYELFGKPEYFHLGLDEEVSAYMRRKIFCMQRNDELWWHDAYFYFDICEKLGTHPWVWSDPLWHKGEEFIQKMPKSVIQSNWFYFNLDSIDSPNAKRGKFSEKNSYKTLHDEGFYQVPACSGIWYAKSADTTMETLKREISSKRLIGYMDAPWVLTYERNYYSLIDDAFRFGLAKNKHYPEYCERKGE